MKLANTASNSDELHRDEVLIPFDAREALTLQEAAKIATVSETTIARWCKDEDIGIGRKIGGTWRVSRVALQMKLDDNGWALVAYLDGDRTSQRVTRYFHDLGRNFAHVSRRNVMPAECNTRCFVDRAVI